MLWPDYFIKLVTIYLIAVCGFKPTYFEIALHGAVYGGRVQVVLGHEDVDCNVSDGRLKVCLLSIDK